MEQLDIVREEDAQEETDNLFVADINSSDKEERKLARRIRMEKRVEALERQLKAAEEAEAARAAGPEKERCTLLQIQLERSNEILRALFNEAEQDVTNVRVANDSREVDRREREDLNRQQMMQILQNDAAVSMTLFDDISSRWASMAGQDPLIIHEELEAQRQRCDELIRQKDTVIQMLRHEVRTAEARFFADQHAQNEDIRMLAQRVERQVTVMRAAHAVELQHIEDVMIQERVNMMENNDRRWDELYKRREEQELAMIASKLEQQANLEEALDGQRVRHRERARELKISLERDCDQLQHEFEAVKASVVANTEKMDYNCQVLKKRESENIIIKANQKRKLNKQQDAINAMRRRLRDAEVSAKARIDRLQVEIAGLRRSIENEARSARDKSEKNDRRYEEIWEMNRRRAAELIEKIHTIDRLLHEQQLGVEWVQPEVKPHLKEQLPSYTAAVELMKLRKESMVPSARSSDLDDMNVVYRRILRKVLDSVVDKTSDFLLDEKLMEILGLRSVDESVLVRVDNIFNALGVVNADDVDVMVQFFRSYLRCEVCSEKSEEVDSCMTPPGITTTIRSDTTDMFIQRPDEEEEHDEESDEMDVIIKSILGQGDAKWDSSSIDKDGECAGPSITDVQEEKKTTQIDDKVHIIEKEEAKGSNCMRDHPLYMSPANVLRALRKFIMHAIRAAGEGDPTLSEDGPMKTTATISRLLDQREVKEYWAHYKTVIPPETIELWKALFYGLQKYHAILVDRHKVNEEVKSLAKQNKELSNMLQQFRTDRQPPCGASAVRKRK